MKKILYVFDDINYSSGAQKVTFFQMDMLKAQYDISVFSMTRPRIELKEKKFKFIGQKVWKQNEFLVMRCAEVLKANNISTYKKCLRIFYALLVRLGYGEEYIEKSIYKQIGRQLEAFDTIIVVSEASKLRTLIARIKHPTKIQWIHTDYALWSEFSDWTKAVTRKDKEIYQKFDWIVTLSEHSRDGLLGKIPELKEKTIVIPNLIDSTTIIKKSQEECLVKLDNTKKNLITVGRLEKEKAYDRILNICSRLIKENKDFCWYIVGEGSLLEHLEKRVIKERMQDYVKLVGKMDNPYPLMKKCNCFVLLSAYEGTPVTIDEAMVLGISVIARDVGGIREQVYRLQKKGYQESNKQVLKKLQKIL